MTKEYDAQDIAQWFINRAAMDAEMFYGEYMTNLKLQKLLYFAQGFSYAINNKPLFKEELQAWQHGPVVPSIYMTYKVCKAEPISDVNPVEIDEETSALLELVYKHFGIYTATQLRNISHTQMPYMKNYKENVPNIKIPKADIKQQFQQEHESLSKEFIENKEELLNFAETCYINSVPNLKEKILQDNDDLVEVDWRNEL